MQLMICCGLSLTYFIGNVVTWRTLALIGTLFIAPSMCKFNFKMSSSRRINFYLNLFLFSGATPCLVQIVGLFFVPESPRWLVSTHTLFGCVMKKNAMYALICLCWLIQVCCEEKTTKFLLLIFCFSEKKKKTLIWMLKR